MSTSTGKTISLPTINEVEGYTTTEDFLEFLSKQDLGLKDNHSDILRKQEVNGRSFLRLNVDKLIAHPYNLPGGPAEIIAEFIEKIKGEGQDTDAKDQKIKELEEKLKTLQREKIATSSSSTTKRHFSDLDNYEEEQTKNVKKIKSYPSPSSFAILNNLIDRHAKDKQLLIHRPPECVGPPVQIYHDVFSQFLRDYRNEDLEMGREHYEWTLEFINGMAEIYRSEHGRSIVFKEKIRKLFGEELRTISLEDDSRNYGVLESNVFSKSVLRFLVEMKNEIGTGGCDPTVQASASFAKYYTQETYGEVLKWCNWPSFILCLAGPWVCILGAVYVEKPIIDPLTDFIPLIPTNNRAHAERVARLFKALCLGVNRLKEYYASLDILTNRQNSYRFFPYPNQYKHQDTIVEFTYEGKLVDHKLLWRAITKDGRKIIVKFAWQYNRRAHELCYEIGKAPKLLYISKEMVDGFYMVVMDYVEAEPLYNCSPLSRDESKAILSDVKEAIDKLHEESIVFADLRDSNILVDKSQGRYKGMLIDFDWAGKDEIECYPSFMNHKHINWPPGAEDRKKLNRKHDVYWLELLKSKYLGESVDLE
ncbi:24933_t:CDS:2 [Cetraspora pellucida]|uniref:24933_t:CDS:1 n=1 Tax=Cetraspora pellucida TaxID=1433469 RepID=A0A9N9EIY2_9GLOM|nr:24933_t:CDS:2 [Cetraspora pellucida]